jgi:signal transduction histidine kinase
VGDPLSSSPTVAPAPKPALPVSNPTTVTPEDLLRQLEHAQQELDFLKRQLFETQRLATIGTITAVIAHEFNNLLTPLISYSQYALQTVEAGQPDTELIRKALTKTTAGATKAGRICTSMLGLARGESHFGKVEVQQIVDEVLSVLARDPQKDGIALRVQVTPGLKVKGDAVQLEQVLLNLLINARQAMLAPGSQRGSGSITIRAARIDDPTTAPASPQARLQVIDTGPGIPEKILPRIFEPFFTTKGTARKGESRGTGLGLAICSQIIDHHGGRIDVESTVGKGTTFNVYLPAA